VEHDKPKDVLCETILSSMNLLETILDDEEGNLLLDVQKLADCSEKRAELRRLRRSLEQYVAKSKVLTYIGLIGHFSSGKSSSINTLLQLWGTNHERITGLHPTDKAVTLITHPKNSTSLIGLHSRGELEVGSALIENEALKNFVIVDTPGSGDPTVLREMVRDFLPICDRIIYVFSAASSLDETDLPILKKVHNELPFIPTEFVVTRANEFAKDKNKPVTKENYNFDAANQFVAELISRIASALIGKATAEEDIFLVDNLFSFNTETLTEFIFGGSKDQTIDPQSIHSHKVTYFISNTKAIRNYFSIHVQNKLSAIESLLSTAKNNHKLYQETVLISNNRLTENWRFQSDKIVRLKNKTLERIDKLVKRDDLPMTIKKLGHLEKSIQKLKEGFDYYSAIESKTIIKSLKAQMSYFLSEELRDLHASASMTKSDELSGFTINKNLSFMDINYKNQPVEIPFSCSEILFKLDEVTVSEIKWLASSLSKSLDSISESFRGKSLLDKTDILIQESQKQICDMLDDFFKSVNIYKAAILAINARELAEKLSIGKAIDDLERLDISESRKEECKTETIHKMFPEKDHSFQSYEKVCTGLYEKIFNLSVSCKRLENIKRDHSTKENIKKYIQSIEREIGNLGIDKILGEIRNNFDERSNNLFQKLQTSINRVINEKLSSLRERTAQLRLKRLKWLSGGAVIGAIIGLIGFLLYYKSSFKIEQTLPMTIFSAAVADILLAAFSWGIVAIVDKSPIQLEKTRSEQLEKLKTEVLSIITETKLEDYSFVDDYFDGIKENICMSWENSLNRILNAHVIATYQVYFDQNADFYNSFELIKQDYLKSSKELLSNASSYYQDSDKNLEILQEKANEIKEEAILPSFNLFEKTHSKLTERALALKQVEFA
jgi:predicted GTPase